MPEDRDRVTLVIGGKAYGGWTSIAIQRDLDALAPSFELGVTSRDPITRAAWPITPDQPCRVEIGGETVITGWVDSLTPEIDGENHSISVAGRGRAGDLVDCAAIAKPGSWRGRRLEQIAGELAKPFGISVVARTSTGAPFRLFALQPGETVSEAILRLCQQRGLLAVSTPAGDIEIITAEPVGPAVRIVEGEQPMRISARHDVSNRFSRYVVKGQAAGDDDVNGTAAAAPTASASDPAVKRYRPTIVMAEDQADIATLRKRAAWEAIVRAARAQEATVTLAGWRRDDGKLWSEMQAVDADLPSVWITAPLVAAGISFRLDEDEGQRVEIRLARKEAYTQLAIPDRAEAARLEKAA
ncbi:contractile injection system protein, VgrG/Pvc8 family [Sphingomonas naphthae]|uniref:Contractile injection system protein, VgrG/Pvc8 family n=1 Tax=Sphingomonas naphthae TaxID=1813468 RepID=A0ABY7TFX2_9SPHN|nr:contractile injection system protein, VgrG/Pvc8 family [Sphingomonas naphthae]WCT72049.1 contractile injection system protein, VgrG/Pvc8 family [Sphingomonas naphthae]